MTPKTRFLNACLQKPVDRPPVWMMRQAGRYLPEYRALRAKYSTLEMMKTPEIACEITLQPVDQIGVDAAILYSDILIVPDAMGLGLEFKEGEGPIFAKKIRTQDDVEALSVDGLCERAGFVGEAITLIKKRLPENVPLLGFAGAPYTVASYMIGGGGDADGIAQKRFASESPGVLRALLERLTLSTIDYLAMQIESGVDAVQLFDTWAGVLSPVDYAEWAFPYEREVIRAANRLGVPTILYIKGGNPYLEKMVETEAKVIGLDWRTDLADAHRRTQGRVALQGNLDSAALYASKADVEVATRAMLARAKGLPGYIANLGHGILPDTPVESAKAFVETVKGSAI